MAVALAIAIASAGAANSQIAWLTVVFWIVAAVSGLVALIYLVWSLVNQIRREVRRHRAVPRIAGDDPQPHTAVPPTVDGLPILAAHGYTPGHRADAEGRLVLTLTRYDEDAQTVHKLTCRVFGDDQGDFAFASTFIENPFPVTEGRRVGHPEEPLTFPDDFDAGFPLVPGQSYTVRWTGRDEYQDLARYQLNVS